MKFFILKCKICNTEHSSDKLESPFICYKCKGLKALQYMRDNVPSGWKRIENKNEDKLSGTEKYDPTTHHESDPTLEDNPQKTLRFKFAMAALQGMCANSNPDCWVFKTYNDMTENIYSIADAMLKAREVTK